MTLGMITIALWGALCNVWVVLLVMQRRARRAGLLLAPLQLRAGTDDWAPCPAVCVVIAARNESDNIDACLTRVLAQDYPRLRVLVVDDRSEDDTAARVAARVSRDSRLALHRIDSLPEGWLGKSHALWRGTQDLQTDWLLFLDADAALEPTAVRTAVAEAVRRNADLLTLWPRNAAAGFWEHLIIPLCGGIIALWFGSAKTGGTSRPFANGQFILLRRTTYELAGGHRAVRDALIEDIPLAERCASMGATLVAAGGADLFGVRMYDGLRATCDGWTRIFVGALRSPMRMLVSIGWLVFGSLLPYVAAPILAWEALRAPSPTILILVGLCLQHLVLIHVVSYRFWRMGRCDARYLWLYPASVVLVIGILIRAGWTVCVHRSVVWRGVQYPIDRAGRISVNSAIPRHAASSRAVLMWTVWIVVAGVAAMGLRNYRVDNSLDAWLPELRSVGPHPSYAVVGWETSRHQHDRVVAALRGAPGVASILDLPTVRLVGRAVGLTPENFVISPSGSYEGLFCFRDARTTDARFVGGIHAALASFEGVAVGGPAAYATALDEISQRRMDVIMTIIVVVGFVLLLGLTGDLRASAAGVIAITLSQIILVGAIGWFRIPMGMSLMMVPPLMMALGLSYVAHRALRRRGTGRRKTLGVLALCGFTTALGIASFATTPLPPIRSFALAGVAGLILVWLAAVTLVPHARNNNRRRRRLPGLAAIMRFQRHPNWVALVAAMAIFGAVLAAPQMHFASDPLTFFPSDTPVVRDFKTLDQRLTGMLPFQVRTTLDGAAQMVSATPSVRKVVDITPLVRGALPGERTLWCLGDNDSLPRLTAGAASWKAAAAARGETLEWLGVAAQLQGTEQIVRRVAVWGLPMMAATVAGVVWLLLRRQSFAVGAAVISLLPVAGLIVVAAVLNVPLGVPSLMIGSISVGIAVDDVLHLSCATRDLGSVRRAMLACWNPCAGSSLINAVSLSCFALSPFGPTRQFGLLMATSTTLALLANQLVLPVLLNRFRFETVWARRGKLATCLGTLGPKNGLK